MSTSANVTYYQIYRKGKYVDEHRQNCMCKSTIRKELGQYQPSKDYSIILRWPDENEADHFTYEMPLEDFLGGIKVTWKEYGE